jgi:hypothetical protein
VEGESKPRPLITAVIFTLRPSLFTKTKQNMNTVPIGRFTNNTETHDKGEVVPVLSFNRAPRHEGVLGERMYSYTHSLTSALDGGELSTSRPGRFTPRERAPGTHWIGG